MINIINESNDVIIDFDEENKNGKVILNKSITLPANDDINFNTHIKIICSNDENCFFMSNLINYDAFIESFNFSNGTNYFNPIIYNYSLEEIILPKGTIICNITKCLDDKNDDYDVIYDNNGLKISYNTKEITQEIEKVIVTSEENKKIAEIFFKN